MITGRLLLATGNYISQGITPLVGGLIVPPFVSQRWQSYRGRLAMPRGGTRGICAVEGCGRPHLARGMCNKHYKQWRIRQPPDKLREEQLQREKSRPKRCSIEGCTRAVASRGLCNTHWMQWWRSQNLERARENDRKKRLENPEGIRETKRRYRSTHQESIREYRRKQRRANPEKHRAEVHEWKDAHMDWYRKYQQQWRREHPEGGRAASARRRARKANAIDSLTLQEATVILGRGCFFSHLGDCEGALNLAHDVAVARAGNTTEANIFCLCRRHNLLMGTRTLAEMFSQFSLLEEGR